MAANESIPVDEDDDGLGVYMWIKAQESRCCDQTKDKWDQDARIPMAAVDD